MDEQKETKFGTQEYDRIRAAKPSKGIQQGGFAHTPVYPSLTLEEEIAHLENNERGHRLSARMLGEKISTLQRRKLRSEIDAGDLEQQRHTLERLLVEKTRRNKEIPLSQTPAERLHSALLERFGTDTLSLIDSALLDQEGTSV